MFQIPSKDLTKKKKKLIPLCTSELNQDVDQGVMHKQVHPLQKILDYRKFYSYTYLVWIRLLQKTATDLKLKLQCITAWVKNCWASKQWSKSMTARKNVEQIWMGAKCLCHSVY